MAVSGSRNFALTRNEIIAAAFRQIGVGSQGATISAAKYTDAAETLNRMQLSWQNENIFLWTQTADVQMMVADTISYTLDTDILEIKDVVWRRDGSDSTLQALTRHQYMALIGDKDTSGDPEAYYVDYQLAAPVLYLYPVYNHSTGVVTGSDADDYLCILDHTSALATTYPITGTAYTTYWEHTTETGGSHVDATAYYSGHVRFSKVYRLQDFDSSTDSPDFPVRWYNALVWGLAAELCFEYQIDAQTTKFLTDKAMHERDKAWNAHTESAGLRISPYIRRG